MWVERSEGSFRKQRDRQRIDAGINTVFFFCCGVVEQLSEGVSSDVVRSAPPNKPQQRGRDPNPRSALRLGHLSTSAIRNWLCDHVASTTGTLLADEGGT